MYVLQAKSSYLSDLVYVQGSTQEGGGLPGCSPLPIQIKKNMDFVDAMILNVLHDLPFGCNQLLQLADDKYIRILKIKIKNFGCLS
jgi:hypothetical protein